MLLNTAVAAHGAAPAYRRVERFRHRSDEQGDQRRLQGDRLADQGNRFSVRSKASTNRSGKASTAAAVTNGTRLAFAKNFAANDVSVLRLQHPLGTRFKIALAKWAQGGCK
ncbi:hypothetical protein MPLSOD_10479 [Mesorhizobium sp. SOD10]|nr:hypothetical protein MPLSOD_10479 [Mesorhizobium sp. SOD10]